MSFFGTTMKSLLHIHSTCKLTHVDRKANDVNKRLFQSLTTTVNKTTEYDFKLVFKWVTNPNGNVSYNLL